MFGASAGACMLAFYLLLFTYVLATCFVLFPLSLERLRFLGIIYIPTFIGRVLVEIAGVSTSSSSDALAFALPTVDYLHSIFYLVLEQFTRIPNHQPPIADASEGESEANADAARVRSCALRLPSS